VVEVDEGGRVQRFWERPDTDPVPSERWVFSGVAMLSRSILQWVPPGPADLPRDVLAPHVPRLHARAEPLSSFRVAVDSPARLRQARRALLEGRLALLDASGQSSTEQRV
jgi:NDP-sugar pyrophosphorylase family protein